MQKMGALEIPFNLCYYKTDVSLLLLRILLDAEYLFFFNIFFLSYPYSSLSLSLSLFFFLNNYYALPSFYLSPFCRYIMMYGSNCRTLDNSDVKENETFFAGVGLISCTLTLLDFIYIWLYHTVLHSSSFFIFFIVCFDWLLAKIVHPGNVAFSFFSNGTRRL